MSAVISECGRYRYMLSRPPISPYPDRGAALFIMLNPSTADAVNDDPTIRRCRGFADVWGCNGIVVANLFAYRASEPKHLFAAADPVGPDNDYWLQRLALEHETVVFAWGANAPAQRARQVIEIFSTLGDRRHRHMLCIGTTKSGGPRHPLYVRKDQPLVKFERGIL